jgi:hypothetical protein
MISSRLPTHFTPSSSDLDDMISNAMAKCDHDIDQARRAEEAAAEARAVQAWVAAAKARHYRRAQSADVS